MPARKLLLLPFCCVLVTLTGAGHADELPGTGKAYPCTACHGLTGMKSAPGQPQIGGRDVAEYSAFMGGSNWRLNP